jgi:hypothetical protein
MQAMNLSSRNLASLEDAWRAHLESKKAAYEFALARHGRLLTAPSEVHSLEARGSAGAAARRAEAQARAEYLRVLRTFTALVLHGKVPEESPTRKASEV